MLVLSEHWVFLLFLQYYGVFLFFECCLSSGGNFFFFFLFVGSVSCVFVHLLRSSLVLFYFGRAESLGISLSGRVMFSFCVGLRCVECRSGTIYLSASLGWVAGLYRCFFSRALLRWVRYDWNSGGVWSVFLCRLQFAVCSVGRRLSVVGLHFSHNFFIWFYSSIICRSCVL